MFKQPTLVEQHSAVKKKINKKDVPMPILIHQALYAAIRVSCVAYALDENPRNRLNENSEPITKKSSSNKATLVYYSADFIKAWLRVLCSNPLWKDVIEVPKLVKNKFGSSVLSTVDTVKISCIRVPTDREIEEFAEGDKDLKESFTITRDVIRDILLQPKDLVNRGDIPLGTSVEPWRISSPSNICKVSRLDMLGMIRVTPGGPDAKRWIDFYKSEKARLAYVANMVSATRVSDATLRDMNEPEAAEYNKQMIDAASDSIQGKYSSKISLKGVLNMRSAGATVNPALVHLYDASSRTKAAKVDKNEVSDKYKAMCKKYFTLTGHKLDHKEEKKVGTYDLRMGDIKWAEDLRASNPIYSFVHYGPTDRIRATQGIISEETEKSSKASADLTKNEKALSAKSSKMFSTSSKHDFTNSSMYSNFKPKIKKIPASEIQTKIASATKEEQEEDDDAYYDDDAEEEEEDNSSASPAGSVQGESDASDEEEYYD